MISLHISRRGHPQAREETSDKTPDKAGRAGATSRRDSSDSKLSNIHTYHNGFNKAIDGADSSNIVGGGSGTYRDHIPRMERRQSDHE